MTDYLVTWTIDIEADSGLEAARAALSIQRDPESSATAFTVSHSEMFVAVDYDMPLWENDLTQFSRLIAELEAIGAFTPEVMKHLGVEMDLTTNNLGELVGRAQEHWDRTKELV